MTARPTSRAFICVEICCENQRHPILAVLILVCLSMVMLTSTSAPRERMALTYYFFQRQAVWLAMG